jgi:hypothetical protein
MLAEIFIARLETKARASQETPPRSNSRFVPFVLGAQYGFTNGGADPTDAVLGVAREKASTCSIQNN